MDKSTISRLFLLLLFLSTFSMPVTELFAEGKGAPEDVAKRALAALKENRVVDFAALMHTDALKQHKKMMLSVVDAAEKKDRLKEVLVLFKDVESADQLRKLDDVAFFASFFEGAMKMQPKLRDMLRGMTIEVIGHVAEGEGVVHVVYRGVVAQGDLKFTKLSVVSLQSQGKEWRMLLTSDVESIATMLQRRIEIID